MSRLAHGGGGRGKNKARRPQKQSLCLLLLNNRSANLVCLRGFSEKSNGADDDHHHIEADAKLPAAGGAQPL